MNTTDRTPEGLPRRALSLGKSIGALLIVEKQGIYDPSSEATKCSLAEASRALHLAASMLHETKPRLSEAATEDSDASAVDEVAKASVAAVNAMAGYQKRIAGDFEHRIDSEALQAQVAELVDIAVALMDNARDSVASRSS